MFGVEKKKRGMAAAAATLALLCMSGASQATENGGGAYVNGYFGMLAGYAPPPGLYYRNDLVYYSADRLNDQTGHEVKLGGALPTSFSAHKFANLSNLTYVTPWKLFGAEIGALMIVPIVPQSHVRLSSAATGPLGSDHAGLGDVNVTPLALGWHVPQANMHFIVIPATLYLPTGNYNRSDPVGNTLSRNYLTIEPSLLFTYLNATGQELSFRAAYDFNTTNPATGYKSGQEFHVDYAVAQHLSEAFALGVGGYYYRQTTPDTAGGIEVNTSPGSLQLPYGGGPGYFGETLAVGPTVSYTIDSKFFLSASWDHELYAYNRPQGDLLIMRGTLPF